MRRIVKITANTITVVPEYKDKELTEKQLEVLQTNWSRVNYTGELSTVTKRAIKEMIECWGESIRVAKEYKIGKKEDYSRTMKFLTLTLSKQTEISDNEIKRKALDPFIQELKRTHKVKYVFWRAETQKNGRIHFHLIIDQFIKKEKVNYAWDKHQYLAGIINEKPLWSEDYKTQSTRIELCKSTRNIAAYVVKYCLKENEGRKVEGRVWGCSDELRELTTCKVTDEQEICSQVTEAVKKTNAKEIDGKYFKIYIVSIGHDIRLKDSCLRTIYEETCTENYNKLYSDIKIQESKE